MKPVAEERLPPLAAALVLEITGLEIARDLFGMIHCRDRGVGPRRKKLGKLAAVRPEIDTQAQVIDHARAVLYEICRVCPHASCKMKEW